MPHPFLVIAAGRRACAPGWCARIAVALAAFALVPAAGANICKYQDPEGRIHYSNLAPERGWKRLACTDTDDNMTAPRRSGLSPGASAKSPSPANFPKVDAQTQKGRDDMRRKVLSDELAIEEKLLVEARKVYADGAPPPLPDEKSDAEKYRERIGRLRQTVTVHEKNVEALKKELASTK